MTGRYSIVMEEWSADRNGIRFSAWYWAPFGQGDLSQGDKGISADIALYLFLLADSAVSV